MREDIIIRNRSSFSEEQYIYSPYTFKNLMQYIQGLHGLKMSFGTKTSVPRSV